MKWYNFIRRLRSWYYGRRIRRNLWAIYFENLKRLKEKREPTGWERP